MAKHYSTEVKLRVVDLYKMDKSIKDITKITGVHRSSISRIIKKYKETNTTRRLPYSGRKKVLNSNEIEFIINKIKKCPKISAPEIAKELEVETGKFVTSRTIINYIKKNGYHSRRACKKPFISRKNKKSRFELARKWFFYQKSYWERIIFSDECKFNLFSSDGLVRVWRKNGERFDKKNLVPTVKHGGGNVMVWACMSAKGVGNLVFVDGIMDKYKYCRILIDNLSDSAKKMDLNPYIFQQDNDPKHKSKVVAEYMKESNIEVLEWPAQSPDLNPIEHLWSHIKSELKRKKASNIEGLKDNIKTIWNEISPEFTRKLVNSMPDRLECVLRSKGGPTKF
ncbi:MAG TPA: IS630 family transposase [Xanthobacteraceae bacterium]|nr:IS630 family transposase [Xanthobacteraceae bacterium]